MAARHQGTNVCTAVAVAIFVFHSLKSKEVLSMELDLQIWRPMAFLMDKVPKRTPYKPKFGSLDQLVTCCKRVGPLQALQQPEHNR